LQINLIGSVITVVVLATFVGVTAIPSWVSYNKPLTRIQFK
jgi:hypothetical protein